jgi:dienelactone hydrolase
MNEKYVHWLQGAAGGAIALAIVGFAWGGWVTDRTAKELAR